MSQICSISCSSSFQFQVHFNSNHIYSRLIFFTHLQYVTPAKAIVRMSASIPILAICFIRIIPWEIASCIIQNNTCRCQHLCWMFHETGIACYTIEPIVDNKASHDGSRITLRVHISMSADLDNTIFFGNHVCLQYQLC